MGEKKYRKVKVPIKSFLRKGLVVKRLNIRRKTKKKGTGPFSRGKTLHVLRRGRPPVLTGNIVRQVIRNIKTRGRSLTATSTNSLESLFSLRKLKMS